MICTPHQITSGCQNKKNEVGGACGTCGEEKRCIQAFGKHEEKRSPGRRNRWEGIIKMYLQELGWEGMDWIDLAQD